MAVVIIEHDGGIVPVQKEICEASGIWLNKF